MRVLSVAGGTARGRRKPRYKMEVSYVGLVVLYPSRQCQHLAILCRPHSASLACAGGSPSGLYSSPLTLSVGISPGLDVYIYSVYLLDISERFFTLRISLCTVVWLVRRPLSGPVALADHEHSHRNLSCFIDRSPCSWFNCPIADRASQKPMQ
jgi:hypothetical protein